MKQNRTGDLMHHNGRPAEIGETSEWTVEMVHAGQQLYSELQCAIANAINNAMKAVPEACQLLPQHERVGIVWHGLLETAVRQIMLAKLPCSRAEFENAARLVYSSCHQNEGETELH